ncbi:hypothetical protein NC651_024895 [Populus alba x Populus x berolinensis]|nr:hypothetical protein NC651_024895 [Populus alba x Populus x berolinensis]
MEAAAAVLHKKEEKKSKACPVNYRLLVNDDTEMFLVSKERKGGSLKNKLVFCSVKAGFEEVLVGNQKKWGDLEHVGLVC